VNLIVGGRSSSRMRSQLGNLMRPSINSPDILRLSGVAHRQRPSYANAGDVFVYRQDSASGGRNRSGLHTTYGYSGFFKASIFDGTKWRNLKLDTLFQKDSLSYEFQYSAESVARMVIQGVAQKRNVTVQYDPQRKGFVFGFPGMF
jgi:hypothetical protein